MNTPKDLQSPQVPKDHDPTSVDYETPSNILSPTGTAEELSSKISRQTRRDDQYPKGSSVLPEDVSGFSRHIENKTTTLDEPTVPKREPLPRGLPRNVSLKTLDETSFPSRRFTENISSFCEDRTVWERTNDPTQKPAEPPEHEPGQPETVKPAIEARRPVDTETEPVKPTSDYHCGCFGFYPDALQKYRTSRCALLILCFTSFTRSFSMNGVMMVVLPTLERRYQIKSYESGMILSSNDVASCLAMLPVSFLATQRHKPRFIAYGIATMGIGNLVVTMVHFLSPPYPLSVSVSSICPEVVSSRCSEGGSIRYFRFLLMAGQLLSGIGATPINTVTIAYLDENLPKKKSSFYIGIFNSMAIMGPSLGFIFGGFTLTYYVDVSTNIMSAGLTPMSPAWVGAWWMGFLVAAFMGFLCSIITGLFPKHLPDYKSVCEEKKLDVSGYSVISLLPSKEFGKHLGDLPRAMRRLLTNVPFMTLNFAVSFNQMFSIGLTSLMTKFFESQFGITSAKVAYLTGPIIFVGGGVGAIAGGALVSKWNLDYAGIMRLCMYNCCFSWFGILAFFFHCADNLYATSTGYVGGVGTQANQFDFSCNKPCNCSSETLNPICGADNIVYLSPCLAGCKKEIQTTSVQVYSQCACVNGTLKHDVGDSDEDSPTEILQATRSRCTVNCGLLVPYLFAIFLILSSSFLNAAPATAASIRCVKPAERSLALGLKVIITRLFGTIPAPVIFGAIVDQACLIWHSSCGSSGNCIVYENENLAYGILVALSIMLTISMSFFYTSMLVYKRASERRAARRRLR